MDKKKLLRIIRQNEGSKLDFKEKMSLNTDSEKKEFAKDVCALANSIGGRAYLVIGIQDKSKKIVGVDDIKYLNEERMQQIISARCDPPIPIGVENFEINKKNIIVITIFDGEQKPYQVRETGAFYIRRGSITDVMRKTELLNVFQEKLDISAEACPIVNSSENLLDDNLIERYFKSKQIKLNKQNKDFLLSSSNIIKIDKVTGEKRCTLGGLLVFSELSNILIPYNMIRIYNKDDLEKDYFIYGSLLTMIDKTKEVIIKLLPLKYPIDAILEAVKNAVLYRDYTLSNYIEVSISSEEIIVKNPGRFIENDQNYMINYSKRNMWIYEKLITLDNKDRFLADGCGFKRMNQMLKKIGSIKIVDSKDEIAVKIIFPGIKTLKINNKGCFE